MRSIQRPESEETWSFVSCIRTRKALVWPFEGIVFYKGTEQTSNCSSQIVAFGGMLFRKGTEPGDYLVMPMQSFGGILFCKGTELGI